MGGGGVLDAGLRHVGPVELQEGITQEPVGFGGFGGVAELGVGVAGIAEPLDREVRVVCFERD